MLTKLLRIDRVLRVGLAGAIAILMGASAAGAYDGTNCKAPGNCWEPKPGYPAKVAGTKYDPKHDPMELNKQQESIRAMDERNRMRVEHFKRTGEFIYDVNEIPEQEAAAGSQ